MNMTEPEMEEALDHDVAQKASANEREITKKMTPEEQAKEVQKMMEERFDPEMMEKQNSIMAKQVTSAYLGVVIGCFNELQGYLQTPRSKANGVTYDDKRVRSLLDIAAKSLALADGADSIGKPKEN